MDTNTVTIIIVVALGCFAFLFGVLFIDSIRRAYVPTRVRINHAVLTLAFGGMGFIEWYLPTEKMRLIGLVIFAVIVSQLLKSLMHRDA